MAGDWRASRKNGGSPVDNLGQSDPEIITGLAKWPIAWGCGRLSAKVSTAKKNQSMQAGDTSVRKACRDQAMKDLSRETIS